MSCCRCKSERVLGITAKCSDCCSTQLWDREHQGYVPCGVGIGGGDYVEFSVCLDCGQLQGKFPLPPAEIEKEISDAEVIDFFETHFMTGQRVSDIGARATYAYIHEAEQISPTFGSFLKELITHNNDIYSSAKMPTPETFLQMYRDNNYYL
jgi:hypothetical protein